MTRHDESPRDRAARALAAAAPAPAFLDALNTLPDVAPGQLWRARRGLHGLLVLVVAVDGAMVEVVPASVMEGSNSDAVDLPEEASVLRAPLTIWAALTASVPMRTLEQFNGSLLLDLPGGGVLNGVLKAGRPGPAAVSAAEESIVFAARLTDLLIELADAPLPGGTGQLPSLLKASGLRSAELSSLLGVDTSAALDLRRGQRALSAQQAQALATALGRDEQDVLASNPTPPEPLVVWMSRPPQRRRVIALAHAKGIGEDRAFADATFSALALAARTSGDADAESKWAALGERYFQSVLDE